MPCVGLWFMYIVQFVFLRFPLFLYEYEQFKKIEMVSQRAEFSTSSSQIFINRVVEGQVAVPGSALATGKLQTVFLPADHIEGDLRLDQNKNKRGGVTRPTGLTSAGCSKVTPKLNSWQAMRCWTRGVPAWWQE